MPRRPCYSFTALARAAYQEIRLEYFQKDCRVIAPDLRGHGYPDTRTEAGGASYAVPELAADVEAALDVLQVSQRFILVCHSFGGALSSYFLQRHSDRVSALAMIFSAARFKLCCLGLMPQGASAAAANHWGYATTCYRDCQGMGLCVTATPTM